MTEQDEDETWYVGPRADVSISENMLCGVTWDGVGVETVKGCLELAECLEEICAKVSHLSMGHGRLPAFS